MRLLIMCGREELLARVQKKMEFWEREKKIWFLDKLWQFVLLFKSSFPHSKLKKNTVCVCLPDNTCGDTQFFSSSFSSACLSTFRLFWWHHFHLGGKRDRMWKGRRWKDRRYWVGCGGEKTGENDWERGGGCFCSTEKEEGSAEIDL